MKVGIGAAFDLLSVSADIHAFGIFAEDEHARALEEQWIDNMGENNGSGPGLEGGECDLF